MADTSDDEHEFESADEGEEVERAPPPSSSLTNHMQRTPKSTSRVEDGVHYESSSQLDRVEHSATVNSSSKSHGDNPQDQLNSVKEQKESGALESQKENSAKTRQREKREPTGRGSKSSGLGAVKLPSTQVKKCSDDDTADRLSSLEEDLLREKITIDEKVLKDTSNSEKSFRSELERRDSLRERRESIRDTSTQESSSSGWGWDWSSSLLSTATSSVSTFTGHLSQGFNTVLEAVETGIGIPNPQELASDNISSRIERNMRLQENEFPDWEKDPPPASTKISNPDDQDNGKESKPMITEKDQHKGPDPPKGPSYFRFTKLTQAAETAGSKLIQGSLGTLENIGKKTMEMLQDGDPGLKKKKAMLLGQLSKPNLSQVLKESRERAEGLVASMSKHSNQNNPAEAVPFDIKPDYQLLFEENKGQVNFDALEMLATESRFRLKNQLATLSGERLIIAQKAIKAIKDAGNYERRNEEEEAKGAENSGFCESARKLIKCLGLEVDSGRKLTDAYDTITEWLDDAQSMSSESAKSDHTPASVHQKSLESLALLTSKSIEVYLTSAQLLLVTEGNRIQQMRCVTSLTSVISDGVHAVAGRFADLCLSSSLPSESKNNSALENTVTDIFLQASTSASCLEEALQYMIPVLQLAEIQ